jgi:hypothetical protein
MTHTKEDTHGSPTMLEPIDVSDHGGSHTHAATASKRLKDSPEEEGWDGVGKGNSN